MKIFPKSLKRIACWLFFFSITTFLFMLMLGLIIRSDWLTDNSWFALLVCVPVVAIALFYLFIRWFFTWRHFRRILFVLACFIALVILFYVEEDFRGWHAWHQFKQQEDHPFEILLPHLAALKRCCQVLELRASAELENNQGDKALDDVKLMFRLADSIHNEPFLISHLVRIALTSLALQPVWEGQIEHKWSDAQLGELERTLEPLNFLNDYGFTMRNERAGAILEIDSMRRHRDYKEAEIYFRTMRFIEDESEPSIEYSAPSIISGILCCPVGLYLMPDGWYFENELAVAEMHQQCFLPMVDTNLQVALPKIRYDANEYFKKLNMGPWNMIALDSSDLSSSGRKFAYGQNSINMARVACALERCRLAHNEYPETLDALAPQFIENIPHDVIGGKPLHYRRADDGKFLLYSIGWNETDDNGQIGLTDSGYTDTSKGDWVWPNP